MVNRGLRVTTATQQSCIRSEQAYRVVYHFFVLKKYKLCMNTFLLQNLIYLKTYLECL